VKLKTHIKFIFAILLLASAMAIVALTGCKTVTPEQQAAQMTNIVRAAEVVRVVVRTGVMVDALAAPQHVPLIQKSVDALNTAIALGSLTGGQLVAIVATLPIDKQVVQIVNGSLLIYDSISILFMTPESNAGTLLIARAVTQGATEGLQFAATQKNATMTPLERMRQFDAFKAPAFIPAPATENTRKF
jgi:hypothetical protein